MAASKGGQLPELCSTALGEARMSQHTDRRLPIVDALWRGLPFEIGVTSWPGNLSPGPQSCSSRDHEKASRGGRIRTCGQRYYYVSHTPGRSPTPCAGRSRRGSTCYRRSVRASLPRSRCCEPPGFPGSGPRSAARVQCVQTESSWRRSQLPVWWSTKPRPFSSSQRRPSSLKRIHPIVILILSQ